MRVQNAVERPWSPPPLKRVGNDVQIDYATKMNQAGGSSKSYDDLCAAVHLAVVRLRSTNHDLDKEIAANLERAFSAFPPF